MMNKKAGFLKTLFYGENSLIVVLFSFFQETFFIPLSLLATKNLFYHIYVFRLIIFKKNNYSNVNRGLEWPVTSEAFQMSPFASEDV